MLNCDRFNAKYVLMRYLAFFLCFSSAIIATGQSDLVDDLIYYSDIMINANEASSRSKAGELFNNTLNTYLSEGGAIDSEAFKYISVLSAPDSSFHVLTWPIRGNSESYDFKGRILINGASPIDLSRTDTLEEGLINTHIGPEEWYGCTYYKMMQLTADTYMLFGFDLSGEFINKKIIDVLSFKDGEVKFGEAIFEDKEALGSHNERIILEYSEGAVVFLNYDESLGMIVHDHLEPRMGLLQGQGVVNIPDGTYEGYVLKEGKWEYIEKIFDHMYEDGDFPVPVPSRQKGLKK